MNKKILKGYNECSQQLKDFIDALKEHYGQTKQNGNTFTVENFIAYFIHVIQQTGGCLFLDDKKISVIAMNQTDGFSFGDNFEFNVQYEDGTGLVVDIRELIPYLQEEFEINFEKILPYEKEVEDDEFELVFNLTKGNILTFCNTDSNIPTYSQNMYKDTVIDAVVTEQKEVNELLTGGIKNKIPIFIGCENDEIIKKLETELGDEYELAVMTPDVLMASKQSWILGKMSVIEQQRILDIKANSNRKEMAMDIANELNNYFRKDKFKFYEIKNYFKKDREAHTVGRYKNLNMSKGQLRSIIDLLGMFNLIQPLSTPETPFDKKEFQLSIDDIVKLELLQIQKDYYQRIVDGNKNMVEQIELEIAEISGNVINELDPPIQPTDEEQKEIDMLQAKDEAIRNSYPANVEGSDEFKEATNDNGELQITTEHLNDIQQEDGNNSTNE